MRYVVGEAGKEYDARLHAVVDMFVSARVLLGHTIFAIEDAGRVVAVATTTPTGERQTHPDFPARREAVWKILGDNAKARYEGLVEIWERFNVPALHLHLNMLGVRRSHAGRGLGRRLLDEVHAMSRRDPESTGVTLSTEDPKNVPLYQHVGYEVIGHARVTDDLETWSFFRRDDAGE
jgi:GNAT superfamily N-acetyltransferase